MRSRLLDKSVASVCWDSRLEQVFSRFLKETQFDLVLTRFEVPMEHVSFCFLKETKFDLVLTSPNNCAMLCLVRGHALAGVGNGKAFLGII